MKGWRNQYLSSANQKKERYPGEIVAEDRREKGRFIGQAGTAMTAQCRKENISGIAGQDNTRITSSQRGPLSCPWVVMSGLLLALVPLTHPATRKEGGCQVNGPKVAKFLDR